MPKYFFLFFVVLLPCLAAPVKIYEQEAEKIEKLPDGTVLIDFGKVAFGNLSLIDSGNNKKVTVHLGEAFSNNRINRKPPGTVRYAKVDKILNGKDTLIEPARDQRNSSGEAVLTEKKFGVILPFRWVEIEGWQGDFTKENIRRHAVFASTWKDDASSFSCDNAMLNRIYELCKYSMKATTFAGVYVDGDRERIPYEADAYINQIGCYAVDSDLQMSRDTFAHLIKHPTWPSEWAPHMIFIAYADYMHTGDTAWLGKVYTDLKRKTLSERPKKNGLLISNEQQIKRDDIVDWPNAERDGYQFTPINTVVNAFHLRALKLMAEIAIALGKTADAKAYLTEYETSLSAFQTKLFDATKGLYRDGEGVNHYSQHANFFALAFHLVPENNKASVVSYLKTSGMKCSVYGAQYLLEALLENGEAQTALDLMLANNDRSWRHMIEQGTTITYEAWDQKYKPNQDWNHAWGAAPVNLIPRYIAGVRQLKAGWSQVLLQPQPANLKELTIKVPTPKGAVHVRWKNAEHFTYEFALPTGVAATIELPKMYQTTKILVDQKPVTFSEKNNRLILAGSFTGKHAIVMKP